MSRIWSWLLRASVVTTSWMLLLLLLLLLLLSCVRMRVSARTTVRLAVGGCARRLGPQDDLGCGVRLQVDVLLESNVGASRPVKGFDRDSTQMLGAHVQIDDGVDTLGSLSLNDLFFGKSRVQVHHLRLQALGFERSFNPCHEIAVHIRLQDHLDIRDICTISARNVQLDF